MKSSKVHFRCICKLVKFLLTVPNSAGLLQISYTFQLSLDHPFLKKAISNIENRSTHREHMQ